MDFLSAIRDILAGGLIVYLIWVWYSSRTVDIEDRVNDNLYPMTPNHRILYGEIVDAGIAIWGINDTELQNIDFCRDMIVPGKSYRGYAWKFSGCGLKTYHTPAHAIQAAHLNTFGFSATNAIMMENVEWE